MKPNEGYKRRHLKAGIKILRLGKEALQSPDAAARVALALRATTLSLLYSSGHSGSERGKDCDLSQPAKAQQHRHLESCPQRLCCRY